MFIYRTRFELGLGDLERPLGKIDWAMKDYDAFTKDKAAQKRFNRNGSDLTKLLRLQMAGQRNSWAIRWTYAQFKLNTLTVFPYTLQSS